MTGRTGGRSSGGSPAKPAAETARREHDLIGRELRTVAEQRPGGPAPGDREPLGRRPAERDPGPFARGQQRGGEASGIHLVVTVDPEAAPDARGQHRLQAAALTAAQPDRLQARTLLESVQFAQMRPVVGVQRDGERAAGAEAGVPAARLLQLGHERGIAGGGGEVEPEQHLLAVVQFGDGGQHARRDLSGAAARFGVGDRDAQPPLGGPPRRDQADDSAPDHEDVGSGGVPRDAHECPAPPFSRHDPEQVRTVGGRPASLSARCVRAPASVLPWPA